MAYLLCLFALQNNRDYGTNRNDGTGDRLDGWNQHVPCFDI